MVRQYGVQVAQLFAAELAAVRADARTRTPGVELVQLTR